MNDIYTDSPIVLMCTRFRVQCLMVALMGCVLMGGCRSRSIWLGRDRVAAAHDSESPFDRLGSGSSARRSARAGATRVVHLAFDVAWIELPVGRVRDSLKVWNHVDELRLDTEMALRLRRNGLRIGAASQSAWPAFGAIFEAAGAKVREDRLYPQHGMPLTIACGTIDGGETMFTYDASGRLSSRTYPEGEKLINIDYVLRPALGGTTDVQISLEIRRDMGVMTWAHIGDEIRQVPDYSRHVFAELVASLTLHPEDFLIIGASEEATNRYLLGGRFLLSGPEGVAVETLLCIRPRPYQTEGLVGN